MANFADGFREGREMVRAARGGSPARPSAPSPSTRGKPSPIKFGYFCPLDSDESGEANLTDTERHILLYGLNGAGKSTRFLIELLMTASHRSLLVFDLKGELAYQTAHERRKYGDVKFINPHRLFDLPSDGFNPLILDPNDPLFFSHITDMGAASIDGAEKDPHWTESAQSLLEGFAGFEVILARRERRIPSLANVRRMLCEPDEYETVTGAAGRKERRLKKGMTHTVQRIIAEGGDALAGLVSRFAREHGQNELSSIQSTYDTQSKWVLDPLMSADISKVGVDFRQLHEKPTTIYVILNPMEIRKNRRWTRLVVSAALCALMRPGPIRTLFVLDEFRAAIGNLPILNDVWSLVRGYGIQLMPILQSALQLKALFSDEWENMAAQAGVVATLGPAADNFTAEWMSKRCGVTTIMQSSFNRGYGVGSGGGVNEGSGTTGAGVTSNQGSGFNSNRNTSGGISYQQVERRVLLPQDIMDIESGHGLLWLPGMGTRTIPFFAPNYWKQTSAPWVSRVRRNPYQ